jgi:hypothetical protein
MKNETPAQRSLAWMVLLLLTISPSGLAIAGQTAIPVRRDLLCSWPESEIQSPRFSPDGKFLVLTTRVHLPDGVEAEGLPSSFFARLAQRQRKDPRFADPIIRLINIQGHQVCEARYGFNPSVSPGGKLIVFAGQQKPITGFRILAETQAGNDIRIFDCEKGKSTVIAAPQTGYLDQPVFLPDAKSVIYTTNGATNGSFGGAVGLERVDLTGANRETLVAKETVSAVPCSSQPATPLQAFLCSQKGKLSSAFPSLVLGVSVGGQQIVTVEAKPVPSPGDMDLAGHYTVRLESVFPVKRDIVTLGSVSRQALNVALQSSSNGAVMIYWQYWRPFSLLTKKWLPDLGPRNTIRRSIYSPDLKYYLAAEPDGSPDHYTLYEAAKGKKVVAFHKGQHVYDAAWSPDSKRFAFVIVPLAVSSLKYHEDLIIYSIP